ncbi:hypothetical protein [Acaryochloris marina]|nr:hypothetical protein [Acaryochloris marina]
MLKPLFGKPYRQESSMLELNLKSGKKEISFKSQGYNLAAHLYAPEGFNAAGRYPAIDGFFKKHGFK